jgi:dihydroorotase
MNLLLRAARIVAPQSPHHLQKKDLLIQKGVITKIGKNIAVAKGTKVVESKNLCVSPGWVDMAAFLGDPGFEHKEDLQSGAKAAAAGGFTTVCCLPNTKPALHSKSEIEYILKKSAGLIVNIYPIGALTVDCKGKDIAEMHDMNHSGAIAFSDGAGTHVSAGMMLRSLLYVKPFKGLIISFPDEASLSAGGLMNESATSSQLGMKGIPNIAEEIAVQRDIQLCEYTESKLHFAFVSTPESVAQIKKAKSAGLKISCAVAPYSLSLVDDALEDFDSNLKVFPPLRTAKDRDALIKALKDGTIDAVSSLHLPHDTEAKDLEFDLAEFGMMGLETAFAIANSALADKMELDAIVEKFSGNPRKILGIKIPDIKEGINADLTIFDNEAKWQFRKSYSKSANSPFFGKEFTGMPLGIVNKGQVFLNDK